MDLQESIKSRRSIREFTDKKPDWREIIEAIHSAQYAPMVGNLFPMKFLIVDDEKIIAEIAKWSEQEFINQAKDKVKAKIISGEAMLDFSRMPSA